MKYIFAGPRRTGTTYMAKTLSEHPSIYCHPSKELHLLDYTDDLSIHQYLLSLDIPESSSYICDFTPSYLYSLSNIISLKRLFPNSLFVLIYRSYSERFYSERVINPSLTIDRYVSEFDYFDTAYHIMNIFSPSNLFITTNYQLARSPSLVFDQLSDFLQLDLHNLSTSKWSSVGSNFHYRKNHQNASTQQAVLDFLKRLLPFTLIDFLRSHRLDKYIFSKNLDHISSDFTSDEYHTLYFKLLELSLPYNYLPPPQ